MAKDPPVPAARKEGQAGGDPKHIQNRLACAQSKHRDDNGKGKK